MKKKKTNTRKMSALLSPGEMDSIFLIPRIYLDLLIQGTAELPHLQPIAGVLNLGTGLAIVKKNERLASEVRAAIEVLSETAKCTPPRLPEQDARAFIAVIGKIEDQARKSLRTTLVAAMAEVARLLQTAGTDIRRLTK